MKKQLWFKLAIIIIIQAVLLMQVDCALAASLYAKDSSWKIVLKDECTTANKLTSLISGSTCMQNAIKGGESGQRLQLKEEPFATVVIADYKVEIGKLLYGILKFEINIKERIAIVKPEEAMGPPAEGDNYRYFSSRIIVKNSSVFYLCIT